MTKFINLFMKKKLSKVSNAAPEFRNQRVFSEELRRKIVKEIASKLHTVGEIQRLYGVSATSVYRWVYKYTPGMVPGTRQVVQMESEAERTRLAEARVAELERALGRKQLELEVAEKILEIASGSLGFDLKKTFGTPPPNGSVSTENRTGTK